MVNSDISIFLLRMLIAMFLGGIVGFERERRHKSAGLRTQALVVMGSTAYVYISFVFSGQGDPTRITGQIASGIGFLGAGAIMKEGLNVRGLNTAATIWCSSVIGCMAGLGLYAEAFVSTGSVVALHYVFRPLNYILKFEEGEDISLQDPQSIILTINCESDSSHEIQKILNVKVLKGELVLKSFHSEHISNSSWKIVAELSHAEQAGLIPLFGLIEAELRKWGEKIQFNMVVK
jgi:putative Mg2+ transporter-C (MgtC) family protein